MSQRLDIRDNRNGDWFFVHNDLIEKFGSIIGAYGIAVYNVLAVHANNATQETFPSYATIAKLIGCSRRKVIDTIEKLAEYNIIEKTPRQAENGVYSSNIIKLLHKKEWQSVKEVVNKDSEQSLRAVVNEVHHVVNEVHHPQGGESGALVQEVHGGSESGAPKQDSVNKTQLIPNGIAAPAAAAPIHSNGNEQTTEPARANPSKKKRKASNKSPETPEQMIQAGTPKKVLMGTFLIKTGLTMPHKSTDQGFWWSCIGEIYHITGKEIETGLWLIPKAIERNRQNKLDIASPRSIEAACRTIMAEKRLSKKPQQPGQINGHYRRTDDMTKKLKAYEALETGD